jgi:hypothetical protein
MLWSGRHDYFKHTGGAADCVSIMHLVASPPFGPHADGCTLLHVSVHPRTRTIGTTGSTNNAAALDQHRSVFVWSGKDDPFSDDVIGRRMMQYLIIRADWEKDNLAQSLLSAIGTRVVDVLHA